MATDIKLTDLTALAAQPSTDDVLYIVDVSEPLAADQSKRITYGQAIGDIFVSNTGNETISGLWTFSQYPFGPTTDPTTDTQFVTKGYADTAYALKAQDISISVYFSAPTTDSVYYFNIPTELNGWTVKGGHAHAGTAPTSTDGACIAQLQNVTDSVDVFTDPITIEAGENDSDDAGTAPSVNTANDDLATHDFMKIYFTATNNAKDVAVDLTFTGDLS